MKTAQCIKLCQWVRSVAKVYKLSSPMEYIDAISGSHLMTSYVVVSAVPYTYDRPGPEAMAFACDAEGELIPEGRHTAVGCAVSLEHDDALIEMGYTVEPSTATPLPVPTLEEMRAFVEAWNACRKASMARLLKSSEDLLAALRTDYSGNTN